MIYTLAKHVRDSIEINKNAYPGKWPYFERFPLGFCDYSSWFLWKFLNDNGVNDFDRRHVHLTYRHKTRMHVWLENETHVLDITGDQFNGLWKRNIGGLWVDRTFDRIIYVRKENYFFSANNHISRNHFSIDATSFENGECHFLNPDKSMVDFEEYYRRFICK